LFGAFGIAKILELACFLSVFSFMFNHLRHIFRGFRRSPLFTAMTLATLAIGIGANTAIFSVIDGVLLKPLPYLRPNELVGVWHSAKALNIPELNMSPALYLTYREENRTFQDIGMWRDDIVTVTGLAEPERVVTLDVTDGTLPLLGVKPILGRTFTRTDDSHGTPETAMISYGYWKSKFAGNPSVLGRRILIDSKATEIIGILPESFRFLDLKPLIVRPFQLDLSKVYLGNFSFQGVARLKSGVTLAAAGSDVARMLPISMQRFQPPPGYSVKMFADAHIEPNLRPFKQDLVGDIGNVLWILMGTIGMVLLVACANVANLLLVRAEGRQQELAIRAAIGAGTGQIARELLLESVTLGLLGGTLGLAVAFGALRLLIRYVPVSLPRLEEIAIDKEVLLFTLAISLLSGLLFGLIPVLKYAGPDLATALRGGGRNASQSRERHRARSTLVVIQVALALVLLICSGLMIRSFSVLSQVKPGFTRPEEIQTLRISIPETQVKEPLAVLHMQQDIAGKMMQIPGVSSVALTSVIPMNGQSWTDPVFAEDHKYADGKIPALRRFKFVSPGSFQTLGNRLLVGRDLTWNDSFSALPVAIVTENMARELWGDPNTALGRRLRESMTGQWRTIVGVAENMRDDGLDKKEPSAVYFPLLLKDFETNPVMVTRDPAFLVRSARSGSESFVNELRQAIWAVNPNLPLASVQTLQQIYKKSIARTSLTLTMLMVAGAMALLLGGVGIYGVISYSVSQRTREIGIRMAVGAQHRQLTRMFVRHGLLLALIGVGSGLIAAAGLSRLLTSVLFGVKPVDSLTYGLASVGLILAAMLASYLPARRVAAVDPVDALRAE